MIDTIILRIHNLERYAQTVNILNSKKPEASTRFFVDEKTAGSITEVPDVHAVLYHNSNLVDLVNYRAPITLPSSHYSIACHINYKADFIEFNFSIPKFRYGTNLFQFIDYFSQSAEKQFSILMDFLQRFKRNFIDQIRDYDLEIVRIDFCYNQFFLSREEALQYKSFQEKAFEKKARSSGSFKKYGEETLMLVTDRYSFKVYDKGSEFRKSDYENLCNKNFQGYDMEELKNIADRTLRYECSFRSSYFFYQWKRMYVEGKRIKKGSVYTYLFKAVKIQCSDHAQRGSNNAGFYDSVISTISIPAKRFCLKSRYDNYKQYQQRDGSNWILNFVNDHNVTFNFDLFDRLYKEFWHHVRTVQIKTSSSVSLPQVRKRITQYNRDEAAKTMLSRKKKNVVKNVHKLIFYFDISQRGSLKKYMQRGMMSRSTYQRIMVVFNRLGLADYNPVVNLPTASLGYQDYKYYFGNFVN